MFDWLEMSSAVQLNPADLVVDETLPSASITSGVATIFGKAPSDEEIQAALPLRTAARQTVADALTKLQKEEKDVKNSISDKWDSSSDEVKVKLQAQLDIYKLPEYKTLINYVKGELVWWNTNLKLSTTDVNTRAVNFKENLQTNTDIYERAIQQSTTSAEKQQSEVIQSQKKERDAIMNRGIADDMWDSFIISLQWVGIIIYILLALRFASFAANANLYKPLPYRTLAFIYTFIFAPIVGPYYLWREIKAWIWPGIVEPPLYESFFPVIPYNPVEELTMNRRLYGYADTEKLQKWMKRQLDKELSDKQAAVSHNILAELIADRDKL